MMHSRVFSQGESPSEPPSRCEVESSVFTTPGDVNPVAEYDVGKLLDLHVNLKQLSLKYNCLLKMEPGSYPSSLPSHLRKTLQNYLNPFTQLHPQRMKLFLMLKDNYTF